MKAFWESFSLVFVAETGDKSQLLVLALAAKFPLLPLIAGVTSSIIVSQLVATSIGFLLGEAMPVNVLNFLGGLLFIAIGLKTIISPEVAKERQDKVEGPAKPFLKVFTLYTIGELGDKTQITCMLLASQNNNFFGTFSGATLAMMLANSLGLVFGKFVSYQLPEKALKAVAAVTYIVFGILRLVDVLGRI